MLSDAFCLNNPKRPSAPLSAREVPADAVSYSGKHSVPDSFFGTGAGTKPEAIRMLYGRKNSRGLFGTRQKTGFTREDSLSPCPFKGKGNGGTSRRNDLKYRRSACRLDYSHDSLLSRLLRVGSPESCSFLESRFYTVKPMPRDSFCQ